MKKLLVLLMAALMVFMTFGCSAGGSLEKSANDYFAEFPGARIVKWDDLFAKMDAGDEPYILSIRQNDVYTEGHIKGAYLAAWGEDLAEKVSKLPTDKPVYVYCYSGQTAGQAVALMNILGIEAYSVKSGFNYGAVKTEGYEAYVETSANEMPDAGAKFDKKTLEFVKEYFNTLKENKNNIMAADSAKPLVDAGDLVVMDIRKAEDYDKAHIEGAINVPFGMDMQKKFPDFADKKILVACYSGQTAGQTVGVLRALGYDAVSLKFGMGSNGWAKSVKAVAANSYFKPEFSNPMITWEAVFEKMDAGEDLTVLSIRQKEDYDKGHIKGAMLAAWGPDLAEKVSMLPTDKPVYVYCYSGQTAGQAVALMNMLGIEAYSIKSGFNKGAATIEGYGTYTTTDATELEDAGVSFDNVMLAEVQAYFNAVLDNANFKIGWDDTKAAVEAKEATVIDIRKAEDFATGHIENAINVPFGANMQESFGDLPAGKLIIACYSGQTAGQATAVLRMLGHDAVSLHFGMKVGWVKEGYPVVTD